MYPGLGGSKSHIYPDGTKSSRKPADGEIFHVWKNNLVESSWQYDDVMAQWINISSGKYTAANTASFVTAPMDSHELDPNAEMVYGSYAKKSSCICGLHSVQPKSDRHSTWCKLYDPKAYA